MDSILIIGASISPEKFSYKAVVAYTRAGYKVYPVNPHYSTINGIHCHPSIEDVPVNVELASLYVPPSIGVALVPSLKKKGVKNVYVNPGAQSEELDEALAKAGIEAIHACSIVALKEK